ncbi:MAG: rRNA ((1498)-N(3))-methyltransferase [Acidimicrobiales bacterium]|nr:rRNA ((1498)-N(3))-methyltransferase [Acidimicrobiales bacterium]
MADLDQPELDPADHHHLARVLRVRPGDPLTLGDGRGAWRDATFTDGDPEPAGEIVRVPRPHPVIGVGFALVKGQKPELAVQKLTEVGVDEIRPFTADRSVVRWDPAKSDAALERLDRVARSAAMQCRRAWLPEVAPVVTFAELAARAGAARADRGGGPPSLDRPLVLVGPEGGWSSAERAVDLPVVGLAGPVLRAETAAIVAGAVLAALRAGLVAPA